MKTKKLAIITGGTGGIGLSVASYLSREYNLALVFKSDSVKANQVLKQLAQISKNHFRIYQSDVSDATQAHLTYEKIKSDFSASCEVLVTGAGVSIPALAVMQPVEMYEHLMKVNYLGVVHWSKLVVGDMIKNRYGRIINLTSIAATLNVQGLSAYAPTKAAVEKFSFILGGEVAKYGITVNNIRPGIVESKMTQEWLDSFDKNSWQYKAIIAPSNRMVLPESIAKAVEFIINSEQVNCTSLVVDGGNSSFTIL